MNPTKKTLSIFLLLASLTLNQSLSANVGHELIKLSGVQGGVVVVLNNEQITSDIRINDSYLVQGLFENEKSKQSAREAIQSKGICGPVTVRSWNGGQLPYLNNMVDLLIAEDLSSVPLEEAFRVLTPNGVLLSKEAIKAQGSVSADGWYKAVKPWPDTIDEWTHWMHGPDNNAVSKDAYNQIPRGLQWIEPPRWWKSHELAPPFSAMVTAKGRLFYIADESLPGIADLPDKWHLIARDAFNGTELWKKPIEEWGGTFWQGKQFIQGRGARLDNPFQVLRRLVAVSDRVFVTLGLFAPVSMLDAATGKVLKTFKGTENAFEILVEKDRLYLAVNSGLKDRNSDPSISIMAVDTNSGKILWMSEGYKGVWQTPKLAPQFVDAQLTLGNEGLFFVDGQNIIALDRNTGTKKWSVNRFDEAGSSGVQSGAFNPCVLTYYDSVLFHCQQTGKRGAPLLALNANSGKILWQKDAGTIACRTSPDVLVNRGLVWVLNTAEWTYEGLDPLTGEKKQALDMSLVSDGTHHNCYRNKATQDFIMYGRNKGVEFFNVNNNTAKRINWAKGACRYGIMPANGMIYFPSHFCTCYATAKLNGVLGLANTGITEAACSTADQVIRGPAYDKKFSSVSGENDWPTYRQNMARTGFQPVPVSDEMRIKWTSQIKGKLTPPIMADHKVFVASKDDHRVVCLDASNGKTAWTFLADGRVDSPPSYYKGRLVFGGRDGCVYCLDAATGELAWRFRAAPADKQMAAFGQLESVWPVFGSLLVHDDFVYCSAGRNANVNSGIYLYKLDIDTGHPIASAHHVADISEQGEIRTGVNADILVGNGTTMHLHGMLFDMTTLKMVDKGLGFVRVLGGNYMPDTNLLTALDGFLDDSFFNGAFWAYNKTKASILGLDDDQLYGVNIYSRTSHKSSGHVNFHPGRQSIKLFAAGIASSTADERAAQSRRREGKGKGTGTLWTATIPVVAKSLLVGPDNLYLAGVRDKVEPEDPWAHFDGRMGGLITIHSKTDGTLKRQIELESPPVFDGLASADGKLFVSCKDGTVLCLE